MSVTIRPLERIEPDDGGLCEDCELEVATWRGLTFRGTSTDPPEYIYLCDEHGGSDDS